MLLMTSFSSIFSHLHHLSTRFINSMMYRTLIKTHHMTSRKKITAICKAAKKFDCAIYLKTGGHPPGVMIAECEEEGDEGLAGWVDTVKVRCSAERNDFHDVSYGAACFS